MFSFSLFQIILSYCYQDMHIYFSIIAMIMVGLFSEYTFITQLTLPYLHRDTASDISQVCTPFLPALLYSQMKGMIMPGLSSFSSTMFIFKSDYVMTNV